MLMTLLVISCCSFEIKQEDKSLVEAGIALGVMLRTAGCYAKIEKGKVEVGTNNGAATKQEKPKKAGS